MQESGGSGCRFHQVRMVHLHHGRPQPCFSIDCRPFLPVAHAKAAEASEVIPSATTGACAPVMNQQKNHQHHRTCMIMLPASLPRPIRNSDTCREGWRCRLGRRGPLRTRCLFSRGRGRCICCACLPRVVASHVGRGAVFILMVRCRQQMDMRSSWRCVKD
jgi:hypothetical protein